MDENLKEKICVALDNHYCSMEWMMMEHDMTKEEFLQNEKDMVSIAELVWLSTVYYPFKI